MQDFQENQFLKKDKRIRKRKISHGKIDKASINKNCPKFIVGYCWHFFQKEIIDLAPPSEIKQLNESFAMTEEWIERKMRDNLNLTNLISLFGNAKGEKESKRNFVNSKALFRFLSKKAFQILIGNRKIEKPLSYLICLEKFTSRLANPELVYKLQFK